MRAALYARVSTELQKEEKTIETQLHEVEQAIKADGNTILPEHKYQDNGWSGAYLGRPGLDNLRQGAKEHQFEIVYIYDKGRLSRVYIHQEIVIEELNQLGIEIKSLHDINGTTPEEKVMGGVMGLFHEYERAKITERFRLAKMNKVRNGKLLGYNPPYGYNYIPVIGSGTDKINGRFEINPEEAEVVKKIFNWVDQGVSLNDVIRKLLHEGIPPKKQKQKAWSKSPIVSMLRNKTYIGQHSYNKTKSCIPINPRIEHTHFQHTNKTSRQNRNETEWLTVEAPVIIDEDTFLRVQHQLNQNKKFARRNTKHDYLLTSIIYCPCGCRRASDGSNGHYYYRCTDRQKRFPAEAECKERGINTALLDLIIWDKLMSLLTTPALLERQIRRFKANQTKPTLRIDEKRISLEKSLEKITEEESRYISAYGRGTISNDSFDEQIRSIMNRREQIRNELRNINNLKGQDCTLPEASILVKQFSSLLNDLSFEEKQMITRKLINKVIATKKEATICGYIPIENNLPQEKAGLHVKYRHRRPTKRRQINIIQRTN